MRALDRPAGSPTQPRITVITPSFNQAAFLERAIESVLSQDYSNFEYFVLDGGSTDGSVDIIRQFGPRLDYWTSGPDGGQAAAISTGWRRSTGEVIAWLNSDDFYLPGVLALVASQFAADPGLELLYGRCQLVDATGRTLGYVGRPFSRIVMLASHDVIPQPAAFMRRSAVESAGWIEPRLSYAMDYDLFMRLAERTKPRYVPRTLAGATIHSATKTVTGAAGMTAERQTIRRQHARGAERLIVAAQPTASRIYRRLPRRIQRWLRQIRPRRVFTR